MNLITQLKSEIEKKRRELSALEAALAALSDKAPRAAKSAKSSGRTWTAAQKKAQAAKMKKWHASRKKAKKQT
jgi:hypothetical protein